MSLVLQGSPHVSEGKRQAVLQSIRELGYRPNPAARSLVERRTRTVGVVLDDLRNPWFVELVDGLDSVLRATGLRMLLGNGRRDRRADEDLIQAFLDLRVDGLALVGTMPQSTAVVDAARRVPTVVAGTREPVLPHVDVVANDDEQGARLATEHLITQGHRRVAHIAGPGLVGELRRRGYEATMRAHGLADDVCVESSDATEDGGYRATVRLLSRRPGPTAIFAMNDMTCVGALSAAEELGAAVPGDLSLVGYDNTYLSRIRHLWLTSVDNASYEVGQRAARCLLGRIGDPRRQGDVQLVTPSLEIRGTTGPPP